MRIFLLFILPFLLCAKPFKVASYNVENLFDAAYQGTEYEEYIPGRHNWTKRMAQIKLDRTAEVICDLDADIIALQEVENESVFNALRQRLKRVGCPYRYGAITHKKGAPIQVALLSRFPLKQHHDLQVSFSPYVRNILEAEAEIDGHSLTIFANHWKSKSRKGVESKRLAYARTLEKRILSLPKNREYIILGDLNSNYDAYLTLPKRLNDTLAEAMDRRYLRRSYFGSRIHIAAAQKRRLNTQLHFARCHVGKRNGQNSVGSDLFRILLQPLRERLLYRIGFTRTGAGGDNV